MHRHKKSTTTLLLTTTLALLLLAACTNTPGQSAGEPEDALRDYYDAFNEGDARTMRSLLSDDLVSAEEEFNNYVGDARDVVKAITVNNIEREQLDARTARLSYSTQFTFTDGSQLEKKETALLSKESGQWKIASVLI